MKKLMLASALILASAPTYALKTQQMDMVVHCGDTNEVIETEATVYEEIPIIMGDGVVSDREVDEIRGTVVIWRGDTGAYSITFTPKDAQHMTCFIVTGTNLEIIEQ